MTLQTWNIVFLVSLVIFIACAVIMIVSGFTRNKLYQPFHLDEKIKDNKNVNSKSSLYFTYGETTRYIKKYVICRSSVDKYIIANYNKQFSQVTFFIECFKNKKKPFKVYKYSEANTGVASKVITIPRKTKYVNIVIGSADNTVINYNVIKPVSIKRIRLFALYTSLLVLTGLFSLRHVIGYLCATRVHFEQYLNSMFNYLVIILDLIVSILVLLLALRSYKKKNKKNFNGGAIEYDFL